MTASTICIIRIIICHIQIESQIIFCRRMVRHWVTIFTACMCCNLLHDSLQRIIIMRASNWPPTVFLALVFSVLLLICLPEAVIMKTHKANKVWRFSVRCVWPNLICMVWVLAPTYASSEPNQWNTLAMDSVEIVSVRARMRLACQARHNANTSNRYHSFSVQIVCVL